MNSMESNTNGVFLVFLLPSFLRFTDDKNKPGKDAPPRLRTKTRKREQIPSIFSATSDSVVVLSTRKITYEILYASVSFQGSSVADRGSG